VREKLKDSYSETGRPSIDPELLLRILLIGYLYGITRERKLVEELHPLKSSAFHGALLRQQSARPLARFALPTSVSQVALSFCCNSHATCPGND
jgi:transposase-like protein DUF772